MSILSLHQEKTTPITGLINRAPFASRTAVVVHLHGCGVFTDTQTSYMRLNRLIHRDRAVHSKIRCVVESTIGRAASAESTACKQSGESLQAIPGMPSFS